MLIAHCVPLGNFRLIQTGVTVIPVSGGLIRVDGEILFALLARETPPPPLPVKAPPIARVSQDFLDLTESHARNAQRIKFVRVAILYCNASSSVQARKTQQTPMHVHVYKGTFLSTSQHHARLAPLVHTAQGVLKNYPAPRSLIPTPILKALKRAIAFPVTGVIVFR